MKDNTIFKIFFVFIICIIIISIYYNATETFNNNVLTKPTTTNNIIEIKNKKINNNNKNIIMVYLNELKQNLTKYAVIDIPININNKGKICATWGNYKNSMYNSFKNNCLILNNSNRTCLNDNGGLSSCNNLYRDGYINKISKIDVSNILNTLEQKIIETVLNKNIKLDTKKQELNTLITDIINKRNLESQQLYFIKNNEYNINDKQHNINNVNNKLDNASTTVNINQLNFATFNENKKNIEDSINFYYKCVVGLLITIIIIVVVNILFSNVE